MSYTCKTTRLSFGEIIFAIFLISKPVKTDGSSAISREQKNMKYLSPKGRRNAIDESISYKMSSWYPLLIYMYITVSEKTQHGQNVYLVKVIGHFGLRDSQMQKLLIF